MIVFSNVHVYTRTGLSPNSWNMENWTVYIHIKPRCSNVKPIASYMSDSYSALFLGGGGVGGEIRF